MWSHLCDSFCIPGNSDGTFCWVWLGIKKEKSQVIGKWSAGTGARYKYWPASRWQLESLLQWFHGFLDGEWSIWLYHCVSRIRRQDIPLIFAPPFPIRDPHWDAGTMSLRVTSGREPGFWLMIPMEGGRDWWPDKVVGAEDGMSSSNWETTQSRPHS